MNVEAPYDPLESLLRTAMQGRPEPQPAGHIARLAIAMAHRAQQRQFASQATRMLGHRRQMRILRFAAAIAITVIIGLGTWHMATSWDSSAGWLEDFTELSAGVAEFREGRSPLGLLVALAVLVPLGIVLFSVDSILSDEHPRVPQGFTRNST